MQLARGRTRREERERERASAFGFSRRETTRHDRSRSTGRRGVYINRRHVDRPSGLSPVLRYCMHATRAVRAREGWFSCIDSRRARARARLCITDDNDDDDERGRPGLREDTSSARCGGFPGRRYTRKIRTCLAGETPALGDRPFLAVVARCLNFEATSIEVIKRKP